MFGCGTFQKVFSQRCRITRKRIMFFVVFETQGFYPVMPFLDQSISCSAGFIWKPQESVRLWTHTFTWLVCTRLVRNLQTGPMQLLGQPDDPSALVGPAWLNKTSADLNGGDNPEKHLTIWVVRGSDMWHDEVKRKNIVVTSSWFFLLASSHMKFLWNFWQSRCWNMCSLTGELKTAFPQFLSDFTPSVPKTDPEIWNLWF